MPEIMTSSSDTPSKGHAGSGKWLLVFVERGVLVLFNGSHFQRIDALKDERSEHGPFRQNRLLVSNETLRPTDHHPLDELTGIILDLSHPPVIAVVTDVVNDLAEFPMAPLTPRGHVGTSVPATLCP